MAEVLPLEQTRSEELKDGMSLLFCGVIGFSDEQMRGTLMLATSREPLGRDRRAAVLGELGVGPDRQLGAIVRSKRVEVNGAAPAYAYDEARR